MKYCFSFSRHSVLSSFFPLSCLGNRTSIVIVITYYTLLLFSLYTLALLSCLPIGTSVCFIDTAESAIDVPASSGPCCLPTTSARDFSTHLYYLSSICDPRSRIFLEVALFSFFSSTIYSGSTFRSLYIISVLLVLFIDSSSF